MSILKLVHRALSDSDLRRILGAGTKIIKYSELSRFQSLDQLLPNAIDYCIIPVSYTHLTLPTIYSV